jgi:MFS family permease
MTQATTLLRSRRDLRVLWFALAISYAGSGAAATALTLYVQEAKGTGLAVGTLLIALTLPRLLGPATGVIADRVDLRRLMVICDFGQAALFAGLALLPPFGILLALTVLTTLLQTIYSPARSAAVPALVEEHELLGANATIGIAFNLYPAVGPLLGGVIFAAGGVSWVMALNVVSFVGSALITRLLPPMAPAAKEAEPEPVLASIRGGLQYARDDRLIRMVVLSLVFALAFITIDNVALVFLVRETLGGGPTEFGVVNAAFGLGMIAASFGVLRHSTASPPRVYLFGLVLMGAATLITGISPLIALVAVFQALAGAANGLVNTASDTVVQRYVPRHLIGRVYGLTVAAFSLGAGVASAAGGVLVDATSPRVAFCVAGLGALLAAAAAAPVLLRRHATAAERADSPSTEPA